MLQKFFRTKAYLMSLTPPLGQTKFLLSIHGYNMNTHSFFHRVLAGMLVLCALTLWAADPEPNADLTAGRKALAAGQYETSLVALDKALAAKLKDADEVLYLKALAQFHGKKFDDCGKTCDALAEAHPQSRWLHKSRFLKAGALAQQRKFEAAEVIYEGEANRLLAGARKQDVAGVILTFADALAVKPKADDLKSPPPNFQKAYQLYKKVAGMEISRELRDEVAFKAGRAIQQQGNHAQAIIEFQAYLNEYDPDWTGDVGTVTRASGMKKENPPPAGKHPLEARFHLAESQLKAGQFDAARVNSEDLLALLQKRQAKPAQLLADTRWQIVLSLKMPHPGAQLERGIKATQEFLAAHTDDARAVLGAAYIAQAYQSAGRQDQAEAALGEFIAAKGYKLPAGDAATTKLPELGNESPAQFQDRYQKLAVYQIGQIRFAQKKYTAAVETWQGYINKYPDGPNWADSQRGIIDAQYQVALDAVADKKYEPSRKLFEDFLSKHPLDDRARQVLFIFGQMAFHTARELKAKKTDPKVVLAEKPKDEDIRKAYQAAIDQWQRLVSKYPNHEESSVALYRIALIQEEELGDWQAALESHRRLKWGSKASPAASRVAMMTEKNLSLQTARKFRTNEKAMVNLTARNIKKVTVRQYFLDLEAYFRKTHAIGAVNHLDIGLIEPEKQWEIEVAGYADYKPLTQDIEVPFPEGKAGVCIVNISDETFEASTLVIRSDIDLVVKSSRRQALVFAEDRVKHLPVADVRLLFSDGKKIIATGLTQKDGVLVQAMDELKSINDLRVFAVKDGHVGSNALDLSGMGFSTGLVAKGYLYTDRPAYQPGQTVKLRGIIRDVKDGVYSAPADQLYLVSVADAAGRLIWEQEKKLSAYGTFHAELHLDGRAPLGNYQITARPKEKSPQAFSGAFTVQRFQLEKVRIKLETKEPVYFRGESVELSIKADYYWGQPVGDRAVSYYLPDGRHLIAKTDAKGELKVSFDTTGMPAGSVMPFTVAIEGENVRATHRVWLAEQGFGIVVRPSQPLVLSGAPFDVTVQTRTPDGKPVGAELSLLVLRREVARPDPVLSAVPWVAARSQAVNETTVEEKKVTTDAKTGMATVRLTLDKGGPYVLRATGQDRFKQIVTAEGGVDVSDAEDATKLRFFAETDTLQVGGEAKLRLHSRLDGALALLTFEGETVLSHRVITLKKEFNDIPLTLTHEHFPNFQVCVAVMDGRDLRVAHKPFRVERQLRVAVKPLAEVYAPGAAGKAEITVTDQLGKPVVAELSLAMVDEALHALFADNKPPIVDFFQQNAERHAQWAITSSCNFAYRATTTKVLKVFIDEKDRLARREKEAQELAAMAAAGRDMARRMEDAAEGLEKELLGAQANESQMEESLDAAGALGARVLQQSQQAGLGGANGQRLLREEFKKQNAANGEGDERKPGASRLRERGGGLGDMAPNGGASALFGKMPHSHGLLDLESADLSFKNAADDGKGAADGDFGLGDSVIRREMPGAGVWLPAIITDKDGKATVELRMPGSASQWRLSAHGVSVETLVGQATANVLTRKDFFVNLKAPQFLQEGDGARILARVHNLGEFEGNVDLTLTVWGGYQFKQKVVEKKARVAVTAKGAAEALFEAVTVPLSPSLRLQVVAAAGNLNDALEIVVPVRPWGLEFADHAGGVARNNEVVFLELPKDRRDGSAWMTITIGPDLKRAVIDMALGGVSAPESLKAHSAFWLPPSPRVGGFAGSDLLAAASALDFAQQANAPETDRQRLANRARALVGSLVVSQHTDGSWGWNQPGGSRWDVSAVNFWALCRARDQKIPVHADTLAKAEAFLKTRFNQVGANDNDAKAVILFALSMNKAADFAHANRLHRERNQLSMPALAFTALTFVNLERNEFAGELIDVLETKFKTRTIADKPVAFLDGLHNTHWACDDVETTALAALAMVRSRPASPKIKPLVDFLLHRRGAHEFASAKSRGPAVAVLAEYFGKAKFAAADFRLNINVNGKKLDTIASKGSQPTVTVAVPPDHLVDGPNRVEFQLEGAGEYAYAVTLRGFSANLTDPKSWGSPYIKSRNYYHMPLEYRGKPIGQASTTKIKNIGVGQRVLVKVDMDDAYSPYNYGYVVVEENLPAGMMLAEGSLHGAHTHFEADAGKLTLFFPAGTYVQDYSYELIGYATGEFRVLPTVVRDAVNPGRMRVGAQAELFVLAPGVDSDDPYVMNDAERFALGKLNFDDGLYDKALTYLADLFKRNRDYNERDLARMLLWIYTSPGRYDARQVIAVFEILRERYPDLEIPFDKILQVGKAYRDLNEFERAYLIFRATVDASFVDDINVSAVLDDEGQFLGSVDYQEDLWREYPDTAEVTSMLFSISQAMYVHSAKAHELAKQERKVAVMRGGKPVRQSRTPERISMLRETVRQLNDFMVLNPESPLADDAAFSMANALIDLKQYDAVIGRCGDFKARFPASEFASGYQYMMALGHFWKNSHAEALAAAMTVATGESKDKNLAQYIVGQVYHAQGKPGDAITWYQRVKEKYPDARQAIDYFEEKRIGLEEVTVFRPGKDVDLKIKFRNIKEAHLQVYRVDLMTLYLREKNLSKITQVNLAGIAPLLEQKVPLGDGKDYIDKEAIAKLGAQKEGAYLVICRGDDLFTSALALVTPLKIEVQEDPQSGRVRANVMDAAANHYVADVHVKAIGSADADFRGGETDLRGIFVADNLRGKATVIARDAKLRYAFYRGDKWLGAPEQQAQPAAPRPAPGAEGRQLDYRMNLDMQNKAIQDGNWQGYDQLRRGPSKGVQIQKVK